MAPSLSTKMTSLYTQASVEVTLRRCAPSMAAVTCLMTCAWPASLAPRSQRFTLNQSGMNITECLQGIDSIEPSTNSSIRKPTEPKRRQACRVATAPRAADDYSSQASVPLPSKRLHFGGVEVHRSPAIVQGGEKTARLLLLKYFERYGNVKDMCLQTLSRSFFFVEFENIAAATGCQDSLSTSPSVRR